MRAIADSLTAWEDFLALPDSEDGQRLELHDGEVVTVPPARPAHFYAQTFLSRWLTSAAGLNGWAANELPYRPAENLQFWYADVGYMPTEAWAALRGNEYPVFAPLLVIEILSPSNRAGKIARQRIAAFSGGTREFWVIDLDAWMVEVSLPGAATRVYGAGDEVPVAVLPGVTFPLDSLFSV